MFQNVTPVTRNIVLLNVIMYLAANFLPLNLYSYLPAFFPESPYFHWWQVLTHMFMHAPLAQPAGLSHILFNMFTLWSFGPIIEHTLGQRRYALLYFASGIGAYLLNVAWNYVEISQGADPAMINSIPMVGASGAIFGVIAAFATLFPDAKLSIMFLPFGIKAKYLMPIIIVGSLYLGISGQMGGVAHFAHIGGALIGFLFALSWRKNRFRIQ